MAEPYEDESSLAAARRRIAQALNCEEHELAEVLDIEDLSRRSGLTAADVRALLAGETLPEMDLAERLAQRLNAARATHRHPNGDEYTLGELAEFAGMSRQWLTRWRDGQVVPGMQKVESLRRHFQLPPGFFTATPEEALEAALQPVLKKLRRPQSDAGGESGMQDAGISRLAQRAARLSPEQQRTLMEFAEFLARGGSGGEADT
ncbi:XRE family transcriptional regulator [Streptomyces sp. MMBL 11-3]|uniref:XRE family transcriptional regulator n=1 Tax=Streptomyces sp. MMBL 11-3 TaxID=3382639 RepID=UPI0039B4EB41